MHGYYTVVEYSVASYPDRLASLAPLYPSENPDAGRARWRALALQAGAPAETLRFYSAPGRTELGGNHTDHNHGRVLAAAVNLDTIACVRPRADHLARIRSPGYPDTEVDLSSLSPAEAERGTTGALLRGIAAWIAEKHADAVGKAGALRGFDAWLSSEVLSGSGLSSSAAVEVLFGTIMADLADLRLDCVEIARMGQYAENAYFGKPCGLMDQTASAVGGIVAIDFGDPGSPRVRRLDFDFGAAGYSLAVVDTGGSHADLTADYAAIPTEMRQVASAFGAAALRGIGRNELAARADELRRDFGDRAFLRAWHFAAEDERAEAMANALAEGNLDTYLGLVRESGDSSWRFLQNLQPQGRPREQGLAVALALAERAIGPEGACRVHGGGFAGTVQVYAPTGRIPALRAALEPVFGPDSVIPVTIRHQGAAILDIAKELFHG